jgi:hypothetical protein
LSEPTPKNDTLQKPDRDGKPGKTHIAIKAFPEMSKIIIYLSNGENAEHLKPLENDLRSYFSANKERYRIEKAPPEKEGKYA